MPDPNSHPGRRQPDDELPEEFTHPRGTLAIVIVFGALFGLAWLGMYFFLFLQRGGPHH